MTNIFSGQAHRDLGALDRRTLLLAAASLFIFGSFLGCAVYRLIGIGESELYNRLIERYFLALYQKCGNPLDVIAVSLDLMVHELWMFAAVFAAGFTPFTAPIGGIFVLYRGLLFGFSLTLLQFSSKTGLLLSSGIYLLAALSVGALLMLMSAEAVRFYYTSPKMRLRDLRCTGYTLTFMRITAMAVMTLTLMLFLLYVYI